MEVCRADDLDPGERKIIDAADTSVGVFNLDGQYYAVKKVCLHHLAPLCGGTITGTVPPANEVGEYGWTKFGEVIRCPWHKWEFDIRTGESVYDPHRLRTQTYETAVESPENSSETDETSNGDCSIAGDCSMANKASTETVEDPPVCTYETDIEEGVVVVYI